MTVNKDIIDFYNSYSEDNRLKGVSMEKIRTQELILRYIGKHPLRILDVGGGTGVYSFWLSKLGHEVHLLDASPKHIDQAKVNSSRLNIKLASMRVGEACKLDFEANSIDLVLILGPLYHLTERADRLLALQEAKRVLRQEGIVIAVSISRYASTMDGFHRDLIQDPDFISIMVQDLSNGQHRNVKGKGYFTTSFFHLPEELESEVDEAGFKLISTYAIESFADYIPDLNIKLENQNYKELLLKTIRTIEQDRSILGISPHIMAIGKKL